MEILLKDGKNKDDEIRRNRFLTRMLNFEVDIDIQTEWPRIQALTSKGSVSDGY